MPCVPSPSNESCSTTLPAVTLSLIWSAGMWNFTAKNCFVACRRAAPKSSTCPAIRSDTAAFDVPQIVLCAPCIGVVHVLTASASAASAAELEDAPDPAALAASVAPTLLDDADALAASVTAGFPDAAAVVAADAADAVVAGRTLCSGMRSAGAVVAGRTLCSGMRSAGAAAVAAEAAEAVNRKHRVIIPIMMLELICSCLRVRRCCHGLVNNDTSHAQLTQQCRCTD